MSKFAGALGVWEINLAGVEFELKPGMQDVRKFRNLLIDESNKKNKQLLFDKFSQFMFDLIKRHYSEDDEDDIKAFVEININQLFEEAMIAFRWTTREQLDKSKIESTQELKKLTSGD